tara:strand:- start:15283 stop:15504 length:222 start_codon:yes stop_codon:yes gene_type:complete
MIDFGPPYLVCFYPEVGICKQVYAKDNKELHEARKIMDRNEIPYAVTCTTKQKQITQDNSSVRVEGETKEGIE